MDTGNQAVLGVEPARGQAFRLELLLLLALAVYLPALRGGFIWDDALLLLQNSDVQSPGGLARIWTSPGTPDYLPLTLTSFWLEWQFWGDAPYGYHAVNILLHAGNALLVWAVLRALRIPGAWLAALLFAAHPVAVPSVAWVSERKNTLSGVLALGALVLWLRHDAEPRRRWLYAGALAAFGLALLAKSAVVPLPLVLLLCVWWRRGRVTRGDLWRVLPFFLLAVACAVVTLYFQQHYAIRGQAVRPEGWLSRLAAAGWALWFYAGKALLPWRLMMVYPRWQVPGNLLALLPLLVHVAFGVWVWTRRATAWGRGLFMALGVQVAVLLPVLGFADMAYMKYSLVADHFQYLALPGMVALVAGGGTWLSARRGWLAHEWPKWLAGAWLAVLALLTLGRGYLFSDGARLWEADAQRRPGNWAAYRNLGAVLFDRGQFAAAAEAAGRATALKEDDAQAWAVLAAAELARGDTAAAVAGYARACALDPRLPRIEYNYGLALYRAGRREEAAALFEQATVRDPHFGGAQYWRGMVRLDQGDLPGAVAAFRETMRLARGHPAAYARLALALTRDPGTRAEHTAEALRLTDTALMLGAGDDPGLLDALAEAHALLGRFPTAIELQAQALELARQAGVPAEQLAEREARLARYRNGQP